VLVQLDGINLLIDPIWSERCSPIQWLGPRRVHPPGVAFDSLPEIDVLLISHNHYDHLDLLTLRRFHTRKPVRAISGLGNRRFLEDHCALEAVELDWWGSIDVGHLRVHFMPARHFSGRGLSDRMATLWGGFLIEGRRHTVYFVGDTGYGGHFKEIARRFPKIDFALIPIGAYEPRWFMSSHHINPVEALLAHQELGARQSMAIHFGTFQLTDEAIDEPPRALLRAMTEANVESTRFLIPVPGEIVHVKVSET